MQTEMGPQPYHCCEIVEVLTDRDVISYAFCLDGFTLLSLAHGACLTKPLTHRLHASHKLTVFLVICLRSYDCMSVTWVRQPQGFCHIVYHLYSLVFVLFLYICFWSDNCLLLIFHRPWQYQVSIQIPQMVCRLTDYQVKIQFIWRQWLKIYGHNKLLMRCQF